jgi:hypothetical protein
LELLGLSLKWILHSKHKILMVIKGLELSYDFPYKNLGWFMLLQTKMLMGEVMREAAFSLAEAKFTAGDFR